MRITDTRLKVEAKLNRRVIILTLSLGLLVLFTGCLKSEESAQPQEYLRLADAYYNKAISRYKDLISKSKEPGKLYFELGLTYYNRGDLDKAIEAFQKSGDLNAKKFIAIADYRLGNFTDALEIFNREKLDGDEYAYYHGLTCERLNLFDQAISVYKGIKGPEFGPKAKLRLESIEKNARLAHIKYVDPEISKIISNAPGPKDYPQAGGLILLADEKIEITPDNTEVSDLHYLIKIFNERGKESFAEANIEYDSTFEKIELEYARIIKPDGSVVDVGSRHIRDVSKYLNFPLYSNARIFIISFPEVAIGACLEYKLKIKRSELINKKDFVLSYSLQSGEPILSAGFSVTLPKEKKLHLKVINQRYNDFAANPKPLIEEKGNSIIYRWQFKDIPQIVPEANMPPEVEINPAILMSTFNSWDEIYNWWWALAKNKLKPDSAIREKVKALVKGKQTDEEKAKAIHDFCAREIRYVAVEYGQAGYEPHNAADIFRNKYGDCKDQAVLLVTMLQEARLKAYPVLISATKYYNLNPDFPATLFNHCIAAVELNNKLIFLDPTAETCSFGDLPAGDQERKVLAFKATGYEIQATPLYSPEHNLVRQVLKIKVNDDESISAFKDNFTRGFFDQAQRYWLLYAQPELIKDTLNRMAQEVSIGAKVDKYNIENLNDLNKPVVLDYTFRGKEYFTEAGDLRIMPQLAFVDTSLVSKSERKYPISLEILDSKEVSLEVELPKGFRLKNMPDNLTEDSPWINFRVEYKFENNKISFRQSSITKRNTIANEEYVDFKNFLEKSARSIKQRIVLERVKST